MTKNNKLKTPEIKETINEWYLKEYQNWSIGDRIDIYHKSKSLVIFDTYSELLAFDELGNIKLKSKNKEIEFNLFNEQIKPNNISNLSYQARLKIKERNK